MLACDFFTIETIGLQTLYVLFFIEMGSRRIHLAGCIAAPESAWVTQQARQLVWHLTDEPQKTRFLIHDNDTKFSAAFDNVFMSESIEIVLIPFHTPKANAVAERWVRSVREECLDQLLILNQRHLSKVLTETHATTIRRDRTKGLDNRCRFPFTPPGTGLFIVEMSWVVSFMTTTAKQPDKPTGHDFSTPGLAPLSGFLPFLCVHSYRPSSGYPIPFLRRGMLHS